MSETKDRPAKAAPPAPPPDPALLAAQKEAQAVSSVGAQIILDYNSDAGRGARGGAATTVEENAAIRDANLVAVGLDPVSPSGPPSGKPPEPPPEEIVRAAPAVSSMATRMTSLAAGIPADAIPPAGGGGGGNGGGGGATAPTNTTVPAVTQSGTTLTCTMGEWTGEPTSYSYAWQVAGNAAGTDAATYDVQAGDVGQTATCTVTATNAAGSAAAPPSTGVTVT